MQNQFGGQSPGLDPFMEIGGPLCGLKSAALPLTTLVVAFLTDNRQTLYGFEINPLVILIAKVQTKERSLKIQLEMKSKIQNFKCKIVVLALPSPPTTGL